MTEEYTKIYCESMAKSLEDKLFFLNEIDINDYDYIVDFGCADGRILEVLDEKLTNRKKYGNINDLNKALEKIFDYPSMFCEINYSDIYEIKIKED